MRNVVLLLGIQGAGKGTVGRWLASGNAGVTHLSAGALLRQHVREGGTHSVEIVAQIDGGDPVPPSISFGFLAERMRTLGKNQLLVLDGYPRERSQLDLLLETIGTNPALFIHLLIPRPIAIERLRTRKTCGDCDATFGPDVPPRSAGKCDYCHGVLARRKDDTEAAIGRRLDGWAHHGPQLLTSLDAIAPRVEIDATRDIGTVVSDVMTALPERPN
jgi:adenylate kinase